MRFAISFHRRLCQSLLPYHTDVSLPQQRRSPYTLSMRESAAQHSSGGVPMPSMSLPAQIFALLSALVPIPPATAATEVALDAMIRAVTSTAWTKKKETFIKRMCWLKVTKIAAVDLMWLPVAQKWAIQYDRRPRFDRYLRYLFVGFLQSIQTDISLLLEGDNRYLAHLLNTLSVCQSKLFMLNLVNKGDDSRNKQLRLSSIFLH